MSYDTGCLMVLSDENIRSCDSANIDNAEKIVMKSFSCFNSGKVDIPHKTILKPDFIEGKMSVMPCAVIDDSGFSVLGVKVIGRTSPEKPNLFNCNVVLFDPVTKKPFLFCDGSFMSALRTAAVTRIVARRSILKPVERLLLIGAGSCMRTQLEALSIFLKESAVVEVYSRGESKYKFTEDMRSDKYRLVPLDNLNGESISKADVIVGCIPNLGEPPIIDGVFKKGVTFFNVGLYDCDVKSVAKMDKIFVDSWDGCKARGDTPMVDAYRENVISDNDVSSFIPYVDNNKKIRCNDDEKILIGTVGLGTHDILFANKIYNEAKEKNIGMSVRI